MKKIFILVLFLSGCVQTLSDSCESACTDWDNACPQDKVVVTQCMQTCKKDLGQRGDLCEAKYIGKCTSDYVLDLDYSCFAP